MKSITTITTKETDSTNSADHRDTSTRQDLSRRKFLGYSTSAVAGAMIGSLLGASRAGITDKEQSPVRGSRETLLSRDDTIKITLGVVAVYATGIDSKSYGNGDDGSNRRHWGEENIQLAVDDAIKQIENTLGGNYKLSTRYREVVDDPDGSDTDADGRQFPMYTKAAFERHVDSTREWIRSRDDYDPDSHIVPLILFDSDKSELGKEAVGLAYMDPSKPRIHFSTRGTPFGSGITHEMGHLLNPDGGRFGEGMAHEGVFTAQLTDENGNLTQVGAVDTIQVLVEQGCKLDSNPYASIHTVMGSGLMNNSGKDINGVEIPTGQKPIYSPAEMLFLQPWRQTGDIAPGKYQLSYEEDKVFGLVSDLPPDHILRTAIPNADRLFIGMNVAQSTDKPPTSPETEKFVGVYVISNDGRSTFEIRTTIFGTSTQPEGKEEVVYADEQLGILVASGCGGRGEYYARVLDLSTDEAQLMLDKSRQQTAERSQLIASKHTDNNQPTKN